MFSAFQTFGRLGAGGLPFSERALWPQGASSPGLWIDPAYTPSEFQDSAGTTPISTIGTVADSSNPVGLILDRKAGATSNTGAGIHLSQSTSPARPVASARVNLLTYSEDFSNAAWIKNGVYADSATLLRVTGSGGSRSISQSITFSASQAFTLVLRFKAGNKDQAAFGVLGDAWVGSATILSGPGSLMSASGLCGIVGLSSTQTTVVQVSGTTTTARSYEVYVYPGNWYADNTIGDTFEVLSLQLNLGPTALPYQRVNTASDYTTTGFPVYLKLDGIDDGLASATFSAGTLTSSMDCLIALRRDSTSNTVVGLYNAVADATKYFGMAESGSSSGCVGSGAGTPTVWVDGVQLTGGTAVTRGTLHTALTAGSWHIVEFRGLDLSTWTAVGHGLYTSYVRNGALGKIALFASGQDANRTKARARMAAYFGVTLP